MRLRRFPPPPDASSWARFRRRPDGISRSFSWRPGLPTPRAASARREPSRRGCSDRFRSVAFEGKRPSAHSRCLRSRPGSRSRRTPPPGWPRGPGATRTSSSCSGARRGRRRPEPEPPKSLSNRRAPEPLPCVRRSSASTPPGSRKRMRGASTARSGRSPRSSRNVGAAWAGMTSTASWPNMLERWGRPSCSMRSATSGCSGRRHPHGGRWGFRASRTSCLRGQSVARRGSAGTPPL